VHPKSQIFLTFIALRVEGADLAPIAQNWVTAKTNPHLQAAVKKTMWFTQKLPNPEKECKSNHKAQCISNIQGSMYR
jgi:hypothetical protein